MLRTTTLATPFDQPRYDIFAELRRLTPHGQPHQLQRKCHLTWLQIKCLKFAV
jgi:hypothetical protein